MTLFTAPARAQDAVELEWSAPPGCPDASVVMARIRSLAGGTLRTKERLRATGRIERRGERFRLTLSVRDAGAVGERTVDSDSCADLAGAAAVALGLLLENKRQEEEAQTRPDNTSSPGQKPPTASGSAGTASKPANNEPPSEPSANDDNASRPGRDGERAFRVLAQLPLATLDLGPLPATSFGLGVGLGVKVDAFRALAVGRYYATVNVVAPDYAEAGADVDRLSAELWAGYGFRAGRFELTPCLTGAFDHYTARGVGRFVSPQSGRTLAFALGGGALVDLHLVDWLAVTASAAVRAETSRPRIMIADFGEVRRLGPVQASFALGLTGIL